MQAHKEKPAGAAAAKAVAVMRAQIQFELQNKKQCSYQPYECTQLTLDGYSYCLRHILCDKNAPYKQCSYVYNANGKRCLLPAPKMEKKDLGYCNDHALQAHLMRAKQNSKPPPPRTAEVLLNSLSHYVRKSRVRNASTSTQLSDENDRISPDEGESKITKCFDPYIDVDVSQATASCSDILDMCSESESDVEPATHSSVWQDGQADSSENESIDSEQEDALKHANVYSAEEIILVTRDKLGRLHSLYVEEYRHLQYMLRERRRRYLHALKREKETCCSISAQARDNPKEQRMYKKLKAYNQYHKSIGTDAILRKQLNEIRSKVTDGSQNRPQSYYTKCAFTEGGVKCTERALPVARHCRKHILEDPNQVLFRACGKKIADIECTTPVEAIFDDQTCVLHRELPTLRSYAQARDSESDYEENSDMRISSPKVKTELIDYNSPVDIRSSILQNLIGGDHSVDADVADDGANNCDENRALIDDTIANRVNCVEDEPPAMKLELNSDDSNNTAAATFTC